MNKKLLIPTLLFLASCSSEINTHSPKLLFNKSYLFAGTYMINQEAEMKWLEDNFNSINFDDPNNMPRYAYCREGAIVEENLEKPESYEALVEQMHKCDMEATHQNISATATFTVEEYKGGKANCYYINALKSPQSNDRMVGNFTLIADKNTEVGTSLSGNGQIIIDEEILPNSEIKLSVVECKNDKIACVNLKIFSIGGGTDNSYKYIFPLKNSNEDHIIQCYSNFLPTEA